jgi:hypothetical protein
LVGKKSNEKLSRLLRNYYAASDSKNLQRSSSDVPHIREIFVIYSAEISSFELLFGSHKKKSKLDIPFHIQAFVPNHQTSFRDLQNPAEHFKLSCMKPFLGPACPPPPLLPFFNRSSSKMAMENGQGKGRERGEGEERPSNETY